jgi:SAM-dependent methyltransferase
MELFEDVLRGCSSVSVDRFCSAFWLESMRFPIKLNRSRLPVWLRNVLPSRNDPRNLFTPDLCRDSFEDSISAIQIGSTWKSTRRRRHPLTDQLITAFMSSVPNPSVLDVGVSAGSSALDLLDRLGDNFGRYYVTDLSFRLRSVTADHVTYFYHPHTGQCIMCVTDWFLTYEEVEGAFFPLGVIAGRRIAKAPRIDTAHEVTVSLLHPGLKQRAGIDRRIVVREYNVFEPWPLGRVDIIKVANVLNRVYFRDEDILRALGNLRNALKPNGRLMITDNREVERVSTFSRNQIGSLVPEVEINGGTDIADLAGRA